MFLCLEDYAVQIGILTSKEVRIAKVTSYVREKKINLVYRPKGWTWAGAWTVPLSSEKKGRVEGVDALKWTDVMKGALGRSILSDSAFSVE